MAIKESREKKGKKVMLWQIKSHVISKHYFCTDNKKKTWHEYYENIYIIKQKFGT